MVADVLRPVRVFEHAGGPLPFATPFDSNQLAITPRKGARELSILRRAP